MLSTTSSEYTQLELALHINDFNIFKLNTIEDLDKLFLDIGQKYIGYEDLLDSRDIINIAPESIHDELVLSKFFIDHKYSFNKDGRKIVEGHNLNDEINQWISENTFNFKERWSIRNYLLKLQDFLNAIKEAETENDYTFTKNYQQLELTKGCYAKKYFENEKEGIERIDMAIKQLINTPEAKKYHQRLIEMAKKASASTKDLKCYETTHPNLI